METRSELVSGEKQSFRHGEQIKYSPYHCFITVLTVHVAIFPFSFPHAILESTDRLLCDDGATFSKFCDLINSGPFVVDGGAPIDIKTYINTGLNLHTIFAPTDSAFDSNPLYSMLVELRNTGTPEALALYNKFVAQILQLHILPSTFLMEDLECDGIYDTLNLSALAQDQQYQKTKCRNAVTNPTQIGGGNTMEAEQPVIGQPINVFSASQFPLEATGGLFARRQTVKGEFSTNVVGCNGVIHTVDNILIPGDVAVDGKSSKSGKAGKSAKKDKKKKQPGPPPPPGGEEVVVIVEEAEVELDFTDMVAEAAYAEPEEPLMEEAVVEEAAVEAETDPEGRKLKVDSRREDLERRRRRLEALLEPDGKVVEPLN